MANYDVPVWVATVVIVLSFWRAFHGPYSDEWWNTAFQRLRKRLLA